ncbi:leucine-rich repeat domain-containing protein [Salana multivorans]|nr:leucine-rich repeat domain-containing protein [Salana multivorans]
MATRPSAHRVATALAVGGTMLATPLLFAPAAVADTSVVPDAALATCVNSALGRPAQSDLTAEDVAAITGVFSCTGRGVADLTGLEHLTGATELQLSYNHGISDLTPLAGLTQLTALDLVEAGPITSLEPIDELTELRRLLFAGRIPPFGGPPLDGIAPLRNLRELRQLWLMNAGLTDISDLSDLTRLETLALTGNRIEDVAPLAGMSELRQLDLRNNRVSDVSPLGPEVVDGLTMVVLAGNRISDLSVFPTAPDDGSAWGQYPSSGTVYVPIDAEEFRLGPDGLPRSWGGAPTNATNTWSWVTGEVPGSLSAAFNDLEDPERYNGVATYDVVLVDLMTTQPADGQVGAEYTFAFELTEAEAPYDAFTLVGDVPGLSLASDGTLRGTPTEAGTHSVVVEARDAWGNVVSGSYSLRIDEPMEPTPTPVEPTPAEPTPAEPGDGDGDGNGGDGSGDGSSGSGNGSSSGSTDGTGSATGAGTGDRLAVTGVEQNGLWLAATGAITAGGLLLVGARLRRRGWR